MRIGIAVDHGGFGLKKPLMDTLRTLGHEVMDFGAYSLAPDDESRSVNSSSLSPPQKAALTQRFVTFLVASGYKQLHAFKLSLSIHLVPGDRIRYLEGPAF